MKLEETLRLAREYEEWCADALPYKPCSPQDLVSWVDKRKVAYHALKEHWYKYGPWLMQALTSLQDSKSPSHEWKHDIVFARDILRRVQEVKLE